MAETVEITVVYRSERFRFENPDGDVLVCEAEHADGPKPEGVNGQITVKGPDCEFRPQHSYRLYGRWATYTNRRTGQTEDQFHFQAAVEAQPHTRAGVIRYVREAGRGNGVGQALATKLWEKFGADCLRLLKKDPEIAASAIKGLSFESAKMTGAKLLEGEHVEHCMIELMNLLDKRGFPKATAKRCLDLWGNQAAGHITHNPYLLMRFRGCGFKLTDAMYLDLGHDPARLKRQALCVWHTLASDSNGHTWYPMQFARNGLQANVAGTELRFADAVRLAKRAGMIDTIRTDTANGEARKFVDQGGCLWFAEGKKARSERHVARCVVDALEEKPSWPTEKDIRYINPEITDHQLSNAESACQGMIGVLGGSPGTGKTYTAAAIVTCLLGETKNIAVCAPTGKAAVRISEAMNEYGIPLRARTIHSTLGIDMGSNGDGWSFKHKRTNPLPFRYIIVDESSMIDTDLMASLLDARGRGTHVLFVGDVNQLPPVGHGAPLRDLIAAGVPYGELREVKRNAGAIVQACADMRDGKPFRAEFVSIENITRE